MRRWIPVVALALCAACNQPEKNTAPATSAPASTPAMTAGTAGTGSGTMTSGTSTASTTAAPSGPKNILSLDLPKFQKGANWQFGVPAPKPWPAKFDAKKDYFATIHTTIGDITVKFYPDLAPKHVTSFIYLSELGYYDGAPFHRILEGFMMQGGDPSGLGTGGPAYTVPAEFTQKKKHVRGIFSMARKGGDVNSAGSQFFVMFAPAPSLDGQYTIFGEVVEGMNVVDKFEAIAGPRNQNGVPPKSIEKITSVDVFTKEKK